MKTDQLIAALAADALPEPPLWPGLLRLLLPALALSTLALLLGPGLREDLAAALADPVSDLRFVLALALALPSLRLGLDLALPGQRGGAGLLALVPLAAAGLWVWAWAATPTGGLGMAIQGKTMLACLTIIPMLSILPVLALLFTLRRGAVTAPRRAATAAGLAGGGFAAAIYALHCTEDNPLFFVTWYGTAILIVTLLSALFGPRLLRW